MALEETLERWRRETQAQDALDGRETTWWLDGAALPDLFWARLQIFDGGRAAILDCGGAYHEFSDAESAEGWLREDEYGRWEELLLDGEIEPSVEPPRARTEDALVHLMRVDSRTKGCP